MNLPPLVLGVGHAELNLVGVIPRFPAAEGTTELESISFQVGGAAAVALGAVTGMGSRGRFACRVADEFAGAFVLRALRSAGIDTRGALAPDSELSGIRFTVHDREFQHRMSLFSRGDVDSGEDGDFDVGNLLEDVAAVIVDGSLPRLQVALGLAASERGIPVLFDGSEFGPQVGELVGIADVVIASERLAIELTHTDDLERSLIDLQQLGPRCAMITLGEAGSIGLAGEQLVRQEAYAIDLVDSSAAGSVFCGAFVAALLSDLPFARCMEFASAAAALSCRAAGPWAGMPGRDEVIELIRRS